MINNYKKNYVYILLFTIKWFYEESGEELLYYPIKLISLKYNIKIIIDFITDENRYYILG